MSAHGEMAGNTVPAQIACHLFKMLNIELEDQGEADHHGIEFLRRPQDFFPGLLEIEDFSAIAMASQRRGQVPQAKIGLFLKSDQHHWTRCVTALMGKQHSAVRSNFVRNLWIHGVPSLPTDEKIETGQ